MEMDDLERLKDRRFEGVMIPEEETPEEIISEIDRNLTYTGRELGVESSAIVHSL